MRISTGEIRMVSSWWEILAAWLSLDVRAGFVDGLFYDGSAEVRVHALAIDFQLSASHAEGEHPMTNSFARPMEDDAATDPLAGDGVWKPIKESWNARTRRNWQCRVITILAAVFFLRHVRPWC